MPPHISTPSLIPLPPNSRTDESESQDDLFATLFSPPTPRASPIPSPGPEHHHIETWPKAHQRNASVSSDFGAFVSVPPADDPLAPSVTAPSPLSPFFNLDQTGNHNGDARQQGQALGVLDELLQHQDDPLYWIQPSSDIDTSTAATPQPSKVGVLEASSTETIMLSNEQPMSDIHPADNIDSDVLQNHHSRSTNEMHHVSRQLHETFVSPSRRSPSLPRSTSHISEPEVQHTQSFFTPSSISSRWVPSFLASAARQTLSSTPSTSSSSKERERSISPISASTLASRRQEATLPITLPSQIKDALSTVASSSLPQHQPASQLRAQTIPGSLDAVISHGTPFSSHPYVPPSGAPGFGGDRAWDKGFEFDQAGAETKSIKLLGRKELTDPVLTPELADLVRNLSLISDLIVFFFLIF